MEQLRDGDVKDLKRKMALEGRPIKTNIFRGGGREYFTDHHDEIIEEREDDGSNIAEDKGLRTNSTKVREGRIG